MFCFCFCSVLVRACVCVRVCACAVQTASSANALWKTNSVGVDGVSRQRSSSDPPAVHPPLPPLRVTSTSTLFPSSFLAGGLCRSGWLGGAFGGHVGRALWSRAPPGADTARSPALCVPAPHQPRPRLHTRLLHPTCGGPSLSLCLPNHFGNTSSFHALAQGFIPFGHLVVLNISAQSFEL